MGFLDNRGPQLRALLRIMAALLFMEHGLMKLFAFPAAQPGAPSPLPAMLVAAAVLEVGGGALIALGLFTRLAAFVCAGEMAVAYFMAHGSKTFWPALNGGDAAILFCFIFLYIAAAGPGAWSVDGMRGKNSG
ncbi:DoxX family protein [Sphingomonas sp. RT2P30]|uniref:DoxX family protein n=1 Tax=Parasphingomonas halimpatiens TaxID=3096162 RepID=UPI002FCBFB4B